MSVGPVSGIGSGQRPVETSQVQRETPISGDQTPQASRSTEGPPGSTRQSEDINMSDEAKEEEEAQKKKEEEEKKLKEEQDAKQKEYEEKVKALEKKIEELKAKAQEQIAQGKIKDAQDTMSHLGDAQKELNALREAGPEQVEQPNQKQQQQQTSNPVQNIINNIKQPSTSAPSSNQGNASPTQSSSPAANNNYQPQNYSPQNNSNANRPLTGQDPTAGVKAANPNKEIPDFGKNPNKAEIGKMLDASSEKYGIPPNVLKAVAWQESTWNPDAKSFDGQHGKGVMQIDDRFHEFARTPDVWDPKKNIEYGSKYLKSLYDQTGDWNAALKRYNGGSDYPPKIMALAQQQPWTQYA